MGFEFNYNKIDMRYLKCFFLFLTLLLGYNLFSQVLWQPQGSFEMQNIRALNSSGIPIKDTINWIGFTNRDSLGCMVIRPADGIIYVKKRGYWAGLAYTSLVATKLNLSDTANMLNPYLRKGDTAFMLSPYLRKLDTASLSNRIDLKVNISDTALMLSKYLRKSDTSTLSTRIDARVKYTDTSVMLNPYLRKGDTANMLSPYLRKSDTSSLNSRINLKLNISDTSSMLNAYLRKGDTAAMLSKYLRKSDTITLSNRINTKVNISDTANMLAAYLRKGDTASMLSKYLRKSDTTSMLAPYLRRSDTTSMLAPYLRRSDTTAMLSPYLRRSDTTSMLSNYTRAASNGLTHNGHTDVLGGTLLNNTNIEMAGFGLTLNRASGVTGALNVLPLTVDMSTTINNLTLSRIQLWTDGISTGGIKIGDFYGKGMVYETDLSAVGLTDPRWIPDLAGVKKVVSDTASIKLNKTDTASLSNRINIKNIRTVTATTSVALTDYTIIVNNSAAAVLTLPTASSASGRLYFVKKISGASLNVTVQGSGAELIDNANTKVLSVQYSAILIQSDGTKWHVLSCYATSIVL